ncbi:MAG: hypothetical protein M9920_09930 [Verrucomicrobiae bacterium]|nr:hypothetical protein [Verrucomicrobiae bacterium]
MLRPTSVSELSQIQAALRRVARRRRRGRAWHGFWRGGLLGASVWGLSLALFKLMPIPTVVLWWTGALGIACAVIGFIVGGWRRPELAETARWVDVQLRLRERLSTALELAANADAGSWRDLVLQDALGQVAKIESKKLVPVRFPKVARWALGVLVVAVGLGFIPEYRSSAHQRRQADTKVIQEAGARMLELTKQELAQHPPVLDSTRKSLEALTELGTKLERVSLTRGEALKEVASATSRLQESLSGLGKNPALQKMTSAARSGRPAEDLQKRIEALQKQLAAQAEDPEALEDLQKQLEQIQQLAQSYAQQTGASAAAARQQLSNALNAFSQSALQAGLSLPQLDDAIAALAAANPDQFLKDITAALTDLDKLRALKDKLESLQAQAEKLGRDLAEQLQQGQVEAAADTLEKLAEKLQAANLSPEEMRAMLEELTKAQSPAGEYGDQIADLLKQAMEQMQQGDQGKGAQSLAAAAQELKDLLQQLGDAQSLLAGLDNLDHASQSISMGLGWGQCQSRGMSFNWFADAGGKGAGSSSTESGLADRPPEALAGDFEPTKIKGQISPGAPMPSITLKGVSIKGQSRVQYEEAATAAQTEAQAALSQEKIPRAYRNAVRDYFDDLKQ